MAGVKAVCGAMQPHDGHKPNIESFDDWTWCPGAGLAACGNLATHDSHRFGENGDETCLGFWWKPSDHGPDVINDAVDRAEATLRDWWIEVARQEVEKVAPKAVEYGSTDLAEIGRDITVMMGMPATDDDEWLTELGIYFYMVGKMARWRDAIHRKARVSDDTLHDIGVYVRMAQRVRDVGGWPFAPTEGEG